MEKLIYENAKGQQVEFSLTSEYMLQSIDTLGGNIASRDSSNAPFQDGAIPSENSYFDSKIYKIGIVVKSDDIDAAIRALNSKLNPALGVGKLIYQKGLKKLVLPAVGVRQLPTLSQKDRYTKLQITSVIVEAYDPLWVDDEETEVLLWNEAEAPASLEVGDTYQGGKIAYLAQDGDIGYNPNMQSGLLYYDSVFLPGEGAWGYTNEIVITDSVYGSGVENSENMRAMYSASVAAACLDFSKEIGGVTYGGWHLPSSGDWEKVCLSGYIATGYNNSFWTSTAYRVDKARFISVNSLKVCSFGGDTKSVSKGAIPMRYFKYVEASDAIANVGDVDTPVVFEVSGPLTAPINIEKVETGEKIVVALDVADGYQLEIDTDYKKLDVRLRNKTTLATTSAFGYVDTSLTTFFELTPGTNTLKLTANDLEVGVSSVKFKNRWVGF